MGLNILYILLLFPLLSFTLLALFNKYLKRNGDYIGIISVFSSFLLSLILFTLSCLDSNFKIILKNSWISTTLEKGVFFTLSYDRLTGIMLVVVTLVSFLVHIFSLSYMKGDSRYGRYYATLSLFTFSMMGLVLSSNLLFLYFFWELVGLCSYVLIGHYFEKKEASSAAIKAFITTKVGDVGMLIGILICYFSIGSLEFSNIYNAILHGDFNSTLRTLMGLSLFIGAMGKSAQFPLHVWLPDAMQGPTPVSALIHAATMVAAGVYLLVRLFFIFDTSTLLFIAYIGGFTSVFAATIALVQDDIKKVLAYSTISQLGFMVMAVGVSSYTSGIFHLMTHAFFKAGLFLGAGAIIYAMHHEQSMKEFGGLAKKFPYLAVCYLCFTLSLCGFPFFAGYWSKDLIMGDLFYFYNQHGHLFLLLAGICTTFLTSFYMFRQIFMVFLGKPRNMELHNNSTKLPVSMKLPLGLLALFALFAGGFNFTWFDKFFNIDGAIFESSKNLILYNESIRESSHHIAMIFSTVLSVLGILSSFLFYYERKNGRHFIYPEKISQMFPKCYRILQNKYYIDELYRVTILKFVFWISNVSNLFDKYIIDSIVNYIAKFAKYLSKVFKLFDEKFVDDFCVVGIAKSIKKQGYIFSTIQTGNVRDYILYSFLAILVIISINFFI